MATFRIPSSRTIYCCEQGRVMLEMGIRYIGSHDDCKRVE